MRGVLIPYVVATTKQEADGSSGNAAVLRAGAKVGAQQKPTHKGVSQINKSAGDSKKHKAVAKIDQIKKESAAIRSSIRLRESLGALPSQGGNKFQVILIQEGMGNLKDCFYYTKACLQASASLFEGVKCFADHPDQIQEQIHPERSTRDILGHFEDVKYLEVDGRGQLQATLILCEGQHFEWAKSLLTNALEYAQKYPTGEFVGLSINAQGEATEAPIQDFMRTEDIPDSVMPKIEQAISEGIDEIRPVSVLKDAVSCDLVTSAGAGGKILTMMERNAMKPTKTTGKSGKVKEAKQAHEEAGGESHEEEGKAPSAAPPAAAGGAGGDDAGHSDADQDKELFQKMIAQYLGEEHGVDQNEAMEMGKHAYEAYQAEGMEAHEAYEAAGNHLKMAATIGKMKQSKAHEEAGGARPMEETETHEEAQTPPPAPTASGKKGAAMQQEANLKNDLIKANAELVKLRESVTGMQVQTYLDKKLAAAASQRSPEFISKFREALGKPRSIAEIEGLWKVFATAYDAGSEESDAESLLGAEKGGFRESAAAGAKVYDFSKCAE